MGECFKERGERSAEGELISVTINSGIVRFSDLDKKDNSSPNKSNYKLVKVGDIAYNSMRMWQGASGYSTFEGIVSPAYTVLEPKTGVFSKFFAHNFKRVPMIQTFQKHSQGMTPDTWNLKFPALKVIKSYVPLFEEQEAIANLLDDFNNLITLHQRKLDHLKLKKKALLQQMFV